MNFTLLFLDFKKIVLLKRLHEDRAYVLIITAHLLIMLGTDRISVFVISKSKEYRFF